MDGKEYEPNGFARDMFWLNGVIAILATAHNYNAEIKRLEQKISEVNTDVKSAEIAKPQIKNLPYIIAGGKCKTDQYKDKIKRRKCLIKNLVEGVILFDLNGHDLISSFPMDGMLQVGNDVFSKWNDQGVTDLKEVFSIPDIKWGLDVQKILMGKASDFYAVYSEIKDDYHK